MKKTANKYLKLLGLLAMFFTALTCSIVIANAGSGLTYNAHDVGKLQTVIANNLITDKTYDQNDPSTWDFVNWVSVGGEERLQTFKENTYFTGDLDLSGCTSLFELYCHNAGEDNKLNSLTSLNVSGCIRLTSLYCYSNSITSLDVSNNTALTYLRCSSNSLTSLDVSNNTALTELWCYDNPLNSLDVSNNTALENLSCGGNSLTSLDVSNLTALMGLFCQYNSLTSLDLSNNTVLTSLSCSNNSLTSLDVSGFTALESLWCENNSITSLDVSKNTALTYLHCSENSLTSLDVSNNTVLTYLYCVGNSLTSLDVSGCTALEYLDCSDNSLTSLDMSDLTSLGNSVFTGNPLTSLNISNTPAETLECYEMSTLTSLDVSGCTDLIEIFCYSSSLTSINLSGCTALGYLDCSDNSLTSLDVSSNTLLRTLDCNSNSLTTLDVSNNTALTELKCVYNPLTLLDLTAQTKLTSLYITTPAILPIPEQDLSVECYKSSNFICWEFSEPIDIISGSETADNITIKPTKNVTVTPIYLATEPNPNPAPYITTTTLPDAVKFVPYSFMISTVSEPNSVVTFSGNVIKTDKYGVKTATDELIIKPSGEIYGTPTESGSYTINVEAVFSFPGDSSKSDVKESVTFTLAVKENSDKYVEPIVDVGYEITTPLPVVIDSSADFVFISEGEFNEFVDVWLSGKRLVRNTEYTAEEGSTRITIRGKTFENAGDGEHTIVAEFREDGDENKPLRRASQNFTIKLKQSGPNKLPPIPTSFVPAATAYDINNSIISAITGTGIVNVDTTKSNVLSKDTVKKIKEGGKVVTFVFPNGVKIKIDPSKITENAKEIDINIPTLVYSKDGVVSGGYDIPANSILIDPPTKGDYGMTLDIFIPADLFKEIGKDPKDMGVYYLPDSGTPKAHDDFAVLSDGGMRVTITGASSYLVAEHFALATDEPAEEVIE